MLRNLNGARQVTISSSPETEAEIETFFKAAYYVKNAYNSYGCKMIELFDQRFQRYHIHPQKSITLITMIKATIMKTAKMKQRTKSIQCSQTIG